MSSEIVPYSSEYVHGRSDLELAMVSNGFTTKSGAWTFEPGALKETSAGFRGQSVSFAGPEALNGKIPFFHTEVGLPLQFEDAFRQQSVQDVISKYRSFDEVQAERVAYLLGGIVRDRLAHSVPILKVLSEVDFASRMGMLGGKKSGDAVVSAICMYILSGGSTENDQRFKGDTYFMSDSITEDPVKISDTVDLGLSQVARLRGFSNRRQNTGYEVMPDIEEEVEALDGFPTVGAEFHLDPGMEAQDPTLWKRLSILNMSQYQRGNYIQMSRNDRGVIEIRMNPSVYPVTIANWEMMKKVVPEISNAFFTMTYNTPTGESDFTWEHAYDEMLLYMLRRLGNLTYASVISDVPPQMKSEEINFGSIYLGQTVRTNGSNFNFNGAWGGGKGNYGQLGMYMGHGDNFPHLAYYPSMALVNESVLEPLMTKSFRGRRKMEDVLRLPPHVRKDTFSKIHEVIDDNPRLRKASEAGNEIVHALTT